MDCRPVTTSDRGDFRVDYEPHRVLVAGGLFKDISIAPYVAAPVHDVARIEVIEAEVVSDPMD